MAAGTAVDAGRFAEAELEHLSVVDDALPAHGPDSFVVRFARVGWTVALGGLACPLNKCLDDLADPTAYGRTLMSQTGAGYAPATFPRIAPTRSSSTPANHSAARAQVSSASTCRPSAASTSP